MPVTSLILEQQFILSFIRKSIKYGQIQWYAVIYSLLRLAPAESSRLIDPPSGCKVPRLFFLYLYTTSASRMALKKNAAADSSSSFNFFWTRECAVTHLPNIVRQDSGSVQPILTIDRIGLDTLCTYTKYVQSTTKIPIQSKL